jgi:hypothetical protein
MKPTRVLGLAILFLPILAFAQDPEEEDNEFSAAGYNKIRVEQEDKLTIPLDKAKEVWAYMEERYVKNKDFARSQDTAFATRWSLEEFWDTYYDTPSMQLYDKQSGVRHRRRINLSDTADRKSGRELMQIKLNDIAENPLERGEIKFQIERPREFSDPDDTHPMIGIVKRSHRREFKERLATLGLDPYSMRPILTVHDMRSRIYWTIGGKPFLSISFDQADSKLWWGRHHFVEVEPELNEIVFTEASEETRKRMEVVLHNIVADLRGKFPFITQDLKPKYNKSFDALSGQIPMLTTLVRFGMHGNSGLAGIVVVGLVLVGGVVFGIVKGVGAVRSRGAVPRDRLA